MAGVNTEINELTMPIKKSSIRKATPAEKKLLDELVTNPTTAQPTQHKPIARTPNTISLTTEQLSDLLARVSTTPKTPAKSRSKKKQPTPTPSDTESSDEEPVPRKHTIKAKSVYKRFLPREEEIYEEESEEEYPQRPPQNSRYGRT
jgi:hypothetical protein